MKFTTLGIVLLAVLTNYRVGSKPQILPGKQSLLITLLLLALNKVERFAFRILVRFYPIFDLCTEFRPRSDFRLAAISQHDLESFIQFEFRQN